jgi:hypothetical protein
MTRRPVFCALLAAGALAFAMPASAQLAADDRKWNVDFGIGFDNTMSGNINSGAMGLLNGLATVITRNKYEDVYGTGLHIRFGGGYLIKELTELRATFTIQSLDADLTPMGDYFISNLYGQYTDYQSFGLDIGLRRYIATDKPSINVYGEATIGLAFIDAIDVDLAAPAAGLLGTSTDFYDQTAAFTLGVNGGVIYDATPKVGVFAQLGIRYVTGLSEVDDLTGTGLETINDKSARWSMPFSAGVRFRF